MQTFTTEAEAIKHQQKHPETKHGGSNQVDQLANGSWGVGTSVELCQNGAKLPTFEVFGFNVKLGKIVSAISWVHDKQTAERAVSKKYRNLSGLGFVKHSSHPTQ
jgi:hypothetical protein